jgi:hypothetical protein
MPAAPDATADPFSGWATPLHMGDRLWADDARLCRLPAATRTDLIKAVILACEIARSLSGRSRETINLVAEAAGSNAAMAASFLSASDRRRANASTLLDGLPGERWRSRPASFVAGGRAPAQ